jgi:hypothetical protein
MAAGRFRQRQRQLTLSTSLPSGCWQTHARRRLSAAGCTCDGAMPQNQLCK